MSITINICNNYKISKLFSRLFNNRELVCSGDLYNSNINLLEEVQVIREFFCINPLTSVDLHYNKNGTEKQLAKRRYMKPRRADINVSQFRNFMFEMDNESLEAQGKILESCGIPWTSIIYSGGKSYHVILSLLKDIPVE